MDRKEEMLIKEKRIHNLMNQMGLKGVLLKRQPNYSWLTAGGKNMVVISTDIGFSSLLITEKERFCIANRIEALRNMDEEGLKELGFTLLQYEWYEGNEIDCIKKVISPEKVGCDVPVERMKFIGDQINRLRYSLTPPEIERYLWLGEKTSEAVESVLMEAKPNQTEAEITGELTRLLWRNRIDQVGFQAAADERVYKYRHPIPTERKIDKYVMLCVMARNKNIFLKAKELYEKFGYKDEWKLHHQGGAMGYDIRDYICNAQSSEIVQENQCFCWNPSISGTKSEDGFIAQKESFVFITRPVLFPTLKLNVEEFNFIRPAILEK